MPRTKTEPIPNHDLPNAFRALQAPMYTLQMARSRAWTREARLRNLKRFRNALRQALEDTNAMIEREEQRVERVR